MQLRALVCLTVAFVAGCSNNRPDPFAACASRPSRAISLEASSGSATLHRGQAVTINRRLPNGHVADGLAMSPAKGAAVEACSQDRFRVIALHRGTVTVSGYENTRAMQPAQSVTIQVT